VTCTFAHDDAAYVLGALSGVERLSFEKHLSGCADCSRALRELAGLPGLLGRVEVGIVQQPPRTEPLPDTLLPALMRQVSWSRRRRTLAAVGLAAAVAMGIAPVVVSQIGGGDGSASEVSPPSATPSGLAPLLMSPVGDVPVQASVTLQQVTWGTRLGLTCTYDRDSVEYELPPAVDYTVFVLTRDGRAERVGSWRSVTGRTMRLSAATAAARAEIASVEVRTPDGRVVLRRAV
jgi:hypothetical protein